MKSKHKKANREKLDFRALVRFYKVFGDLYKRHWKLICLAYSGLLFTVLIALLLPWPLKLILDYIILDVPLPEQARFLTQIIGDSTETLLLFLVGAYIALHFSDSFFSYIYKVGMLSIGRMMIADLRKRVFRHLQRLSLTFHGDMRAGDMVYRLTSDTDNMRAILIMLPNATIYRFIIIFSHVGLMLFLDWRLALLAFSIIPILFFYHRRFGSGVKRATKKKRKKESEISSIVSENVSAMALVHAYGGEETQEARFKHENRESLKSAIAAMKLSKMFKRVSDILIALGTAAVVYWGGLLTLKGAILPGTLVLFVSYLRNLYKPIEKYAGILIEVARAQVSGERLLELVESEQTVENAPDAVPAAKFVGRVEFQNVTFSYDKQHPVLRDISLSVDAGSTVALVGHSGAGKSTLISLLLRFYEPEAGRILIDGHPIRSFTIDSLRDQITILMQDAKLFNKSVAENIAFGKEGATREEIESAARAAQAHDFIMQMPNQYETVISEGGDNLSGGQKQRLNIARAIIRNTPLLILDEPTTSLDSRTEAVVQTAIDELKKGRTTFVIAHRFSTLRTVDKIALLNQGSLVAEGTHEQLLEQSELYKHLYGLQNVEPESETETEKPELPVSQ